MTPLEREAKWARWPQGGAGDAIDFACDHCGPAESQAFLEDWRSDRANKWLGYVRWLTAQRDGARAASCDTQPKAGDVEQAPLVSTRSAKPRRPRHSMKHTRITSSEIARAKEAAA